MPGIPVTIDEQTIVVERGTSLLEAAHRLGIHIPALCHHEALAPYGACRLCQIEIVSDGQSRVWTACEYPVLRPGETVRTDGEAALRVRRLVVELLLARCPDVPVVRGLAEELGVRPGRLRATAEPSECILCGLCVRVCGEVLERNAIGFAGRGVGRKVSTPYAVNSERCIGCGACAHVCPTGVIRIHETDGKRTLRFWNSEIELAACRQCGAYFAPAAALALASQFVGELDEILGLCPVCRIRQTRRGIVLMRSTRSVPEG